MRIVSTKVVKEHWYFEADWALLVTLAVGGANKPLRDMVVVTDFRILCIAFYKLVTADVAPRCINIFLLLASTKALHRPIRPENRQDLCFPHDERVKKLGESIFSDLHHSPLVKVINFEVRMAAAAHTLCCWVYVVCLTWRTDDSRMD